MKEDALKRPTAWITAGLVLAAGTGTSAQTIRDRTEEKVRSAMMADALEEERQERTRPTRARSLTRTWSGIALAAAGAATALIGRTCRTMGSLPRESLRPFHYGSVRTSMTGLYAYRDDGECRIDFDIHVTATDELTGSAEYQESHVYRDLHHYAPQSLPENLTGTARAEMGFDQQRLYSGIAMTAAGIALATIFADIPVRVTEMSPSRITVGSLIAWEKNPQTGWTTATRSACGANDRHTARRAKLKSRQQTAPADRRRPPSCTISRHLSDTVTADLVKPYARNPTEPRTPRVH